MKVQFLKSINYFLKIIIFGKKMPVSRNDEFTTLATLYGAYPVPSGSTDADKNLIGAPLYFVRVGYVNNRVLGASGRTAYYWSSTVESSAAARNVNFNYSGIWPQSTSQYKWNAHPLRCIVR